MVHSKIATNSDMVLGLSDAREIRDPISLPIHGTVPAYLRQSTLYRVGPGKYNVKHADGSPYVIRHWFDGLSLLHAFHIDAEHNSVTYRNRFLVDSLTRTIESVPGKKWSDFSFGSTDPCRSLLGRFFQLWTPRPVDPKTGLPPVPNVGVTVQNMPSKDLTIRTDTATGTTLDEHSLEVDHFFSFSEIDPRLKGQMSSAHGHYDSKTGEFFNFVYDLGGSGPTPYTVFKIRRDGSAQVLATLSEEPRYIHSFSTTENYVVLMLWPMRVSPIKVLWTRNILDGSSYERSIDTRFVVISRHGEGVVATYTSPSFFCFHTANAYERDGDIHIDLCRYDDNKVVHEFRMDYLKSASRFSPSYLTRFTLKEIASPSVGRDGEPAQAVEEVINEHDLEFPSLNPTRERTEYKFVFGASSEYGLFDVIAKVDVTTGKRTTWGCGRAVMGEPIFVGNPEGEDEDDGCVLVVVLDVEMEKSKMVILDAKNMTEIASAQVPQIVPLGFHGMFKYA